MSSKPVLKLDWCSHQAARYAVEHWHYSRRMPAGKLVQVGVWEDDKFTGCILFGRGATRRIGKPFGLPQTQVCELVRVALREHVWPVSRMLAIAIRMIKKQSPGLRLIVSFADTEQQHYGGIYQSSGWLYLGGTGHSGGKYEVNGRMWHPKSLHSKYGKGGQSIPWLRANIDPNARRIATDVKHKYVMPLDDAMRKQIAPLAKPYPKRAGSIAADAPAVHAGEGGSTPTPALQQAVAD